MKTLAIAAAIFLTAGIAGIVTYSVGFLLGERKARHAQFVAEQELLLRSIDGDPSFSNIEIFENSNGGIFVVAKFSSHSDCEIFRLDH